MPTLRLARAYSHRMKAVSGDSACATPCPTPRDGWAPRCTKALRLPGCVTTVAGLPVSKQPLGNIAADQVVLAAGPWSGIGGHWIAPEGPLDLPVRGVKGQRILLRISGFLPCSPVRNSEVYVVPRLDGNILVASTREEGRSDETVTADGIATLVSWSRPVVSNACQRGLRVGQGGRSPRHPRRSANHRPRARY